MASTSTWLRKTRTRAAGDPLDHVDELVLDRFLELLARLPHVLAGAGVDQGALGGGEDLLENADRVVTLQVAARLGRAAAVKARVQLHDLARELRDKRPVGQGFLGVRTIQATAPGD